MQKLSPKFRKTVGAQKAGMVAVPRFQPLLYDPMHEGLGIWVPGFDGRREPDGWFHPSTHPLWNARQLYHYLTDPGQVKGDPFEWEGTLAVTVGSVIHDLIQHVGLVHGILHAYPDCPCEQGHNDAEVLLVDEEVGSRGHSDGAMDTGDGFEIKSAHPAIVTNINGVEFGPERTAAWRDKKPAYYAQAQEYLRMSGRKRMVTLIVSTSYPFEMAEVHIPFDRAYAHDLREKYLRVRAAVERGRPPYECCGGQKSCPVRTVCEGA